tara:strand:+ start:78 stop:338 length:261 start_codon:yes stop_codon:yes gene_type:complete
MKFIITFSSQKASLAANKLPQYKKVQKIFDNVFAIESKNNAKEIHSDITKIVGKSVDVMVIETNGIAVGNSPIITGSFNYVLSTLP